MRRFLSLCHYVVKTTGSSSIMSSYAEKNAAEGTLNHLQRADSDSSRTVAYRQTFGKNPGVVFLPGFMSNMRGRKAVALQRFCQERGQAYTRFDYQGCGESLGKLEPGVKAFDVWRLDALAVLDQLTSGPQILVGSSMGGALMLLVAMERPQRIQGLVGVAVAVNFEKPLSYTDDAKEGSAVNPTYVTPIDFVDLRYKRCLMANQIPVTCPVRLLHGMRDDTVPFMTSLDVAKRLVSPDVDVLYRKNGDHRLSEEGDIQLLLEIVEALIKTVA